METLYTAIVLFFILAVLDVSISEIRRQGGRRR
jgi:hypothetical protein